MKIINSLVNGFRRSVRTWKGALVITLALLMITLLFTVPFKRFLKSLSGSGMAFDEFTGGFNFDIIVDLFSLSKSSVASFFMGVLLLIIIGIVFYTFFSGGLFSYISRAKGRFSVAHFLRDSAKYFWPFLGLSILIALMTGFIVLFMAIITAGLFSGIKPEAAVLQLSITVIYFAVVAIILSVFLLVADYSRAHYVAERIPGFFRSMGYGFRKTFDTFASSVPMMLFLLLVQILFVWLMTSLVAGVRLKSGFLVFMMFLLSQVLFFIRTLLRVWRYSSVTSMMELSESIQLIVPATGSATDHVSDHRPDLTQEHTQNLVQDSLPDPLPDSLPDLAQDHATNIIVDPLPGNSTASHGNLKDKGLPDSDLLV